MTLPTSSSPPSSSTIGSNSSPNSRGQTRLDLSELPPICVLPTHLSQEELHEIEDQLEDHGAPLTYDYTEARIFIGKVGTKRRAELELRTKKLWTEEIPIALEAEESPEIISRIETPRKRRKVSPSTKPVTQAQDDGSTTESEHQSQLSFRTRKLPQQTRPLQNHSVDGVLEGSDTESEPESQAKAASESVIKRSGSKASLTNLPSSNLDSLEPKLPLRSPRTPSPKPRRSPILDVDFSNGIRVLKLQWLEDSLKKGEFMPIDSYLIYHGRKASRPPKASTPELPDLTLRSPSKRVSPKPQETLAEQPQTQSILERAKADAARSGYSQQSHYAPAPHGIRRFRDQTKHSYTDRTVSHTQTRAQLLATTTSEYDGSDSDIPPPPEWVKQHLLYSCQRSTPTNPPNDPFIAELKKIKLARLLTGDEIGIRAYSTSIASLAAYPDLITSAREILRLPGCDTKIANLWIEWKNTGVVAAAEEAEQDETLQILNNFYNIWGVGATTAREFYYDRGWRDNDDVVEFGWKTLSRVQQIGVKYYEEFLMGIPRSEVELIAAKVKEHAIKVRDEGTELMVVGGYRRGKEESGDVDMIVSHRDLSKTLNLVTDIVASLEVEGWVTHTLLLTLKSTERKQATLPFKSVGVASHGAGFDTLDKALVVWQNPYWPAQDADLKENPKAKNPNPHRRVDIIISPWRTVGCAVTGWSGGTTFQRDLRRYVKKEKGWKFDSSGVRNRSSGEVVNLEGEFGVEGSMLDAEKAVFEGCGLVYREPTERCTG